MGDDVVQGVERVTDSLTSSQQGFKLAVPDSQSSDYPSDGSVLLIAGWGEGLGQIVAGSCLEKQAGFLIPGVLGLRRVSYQSGMSVPD